MRRFFTSVWEVIAFPFRLLYNILAFPFRAVRRFIKFLNTDPEDTPLAEIFANIATKTEMQQGVLQNIEVMRKHLLRAVGVLTLFIIAAFWAAVPVMEFLAVPIGGLENLQAIQVTEELGVFMRVAMMTGIAAAFPFLAFEAWRFIAPGLWSRDKKMGLIGIPISYLLFLAGMAFTFYVLLPAALPFLGGFTRIAEFWAAREYFNFVTGLMLWIGLFFEMPLAVYFLTAIGLVEPKFLAEQWRLAIVLIAVLAAAVTPTVDPVNMGLVMIPMIMLYFISIGMSYIARAGRRKAKAAAQDALEETGAG